MKQNQCKDVTFKDVVRMFDLLKKQGYKVEDIMQMKIDIVKDVKELVWDWKLISNRGHYEK